jgi:hypothetical protein
VRVRVVVLEPALVHVRVAVDEVAVAVLVLVLDVVVVVRRVRVVVHDAAVRVLVRVRLGVRMILVGHAAGLPDERAAHERANGASAARRSPRRAACLCQRGLSAGVGACTGSWRSSVGDPPIWFFSEGT